MQSQPASYRRLLETDRPIIFKDINKLLIELEKSRSKRAKKLKLQKERGQVKDTQKKSFKILSLQVSWISHKKKRKGSF